MTSSGHAMLGRGILAGALLAVGAAVLWLVAMSASWLSTCPGGRDDALVGLDKGVSAWPPGADCASAGWPDSGLYVYEALPWAKPLIVGLLLAALVAVVTGVVGAVRGVRLRDERVGSPV